VIYNGVDSDLFAPPGPDDKRRLRCVLQIPENCIVVAYVGRKQAVKGFLVFLKVMEALLPRYANLMALAVGPTPHEALRETEFAEIRALSNKLGRGGRYRELPALPHQRLANIYKVTDVVLAPTYFQGEQHPLAICEALSAGTVAIASDWAGIKETIRDGETGFLLRKPGDFGEALQVTGRVLHDLHGLTHMRTAARLHVLENFHWQRSANRLETLFFELALSHLGRG
jgi:glycosyltransferase involved in cell wall biosynthesis